MSSTSKRSGNQPFKLQFGGGATQPIEAEPQLGDAAEDVDDEFVFYNSAAMLRELKAAPNKDTDAPSAQADKAESATPDPDAPSEPVEDDIGSVMDAPDPVAPEASPKPMAAGVSPADDMVEDNILDPNWEPPEVRAVEPPPEAPIAPRSLQVGSTTLRPEIDAPQAVPPRPERPISEFGFVLPEDDTNSTRRGWAAYGALAAGLVLAVGAAGGAWYQMRGSSDPVVQRSDVNPRPETMIAAADPVADEKPGNAAADATGPAAKSAAGSETTEPGLDPAQVVDSPRAAPPAPSAPVPDQVAMAPKALPPRDPSGPSAQDVSPSPDQPGLALTEPGMVVPDTNAVPKTPAPEQVVTAGTDHPNLPSNRNVATLPRPDLGPEVANPSPGALAAVQPERDASERPDQSVLPGPLPERATARPVLQAPDLPFGLEQSPAVASVATFALIGPEVVDGLPLLPDFALDAVPYRLTAGQSWVPAHEGTALGNLETESPALPVTQTGLGLIADPNAPQSATQLTWTLPPQAFEDLPVRPSDPTTPERATFSVPVLLAATAVLNGRLDKAGADGSSGYSAAQLPTPGRPVQPRLASLAESAGVALAATADPAIRTARPMVPQLNGGPQDRDWAALPTNAAGTVQIRVASLATPAAGTTALIGSDGLQAPRRRDAAELAAAVRPDPGNLSTPKPSQPWAIAISTGQPIAPSGGYVAFTYPASGSLPEQAVPQNLSRQSDGDQAPESFDVPASAPSQVAIKTLSRPEEDVSAAPPATTDSYVRLALADALEVPLAGSSSPPVVPGIAPPAANQVVTEPPMALATIIPGDTSQLPGRDRITYAARPNALSRDTSSLSATPGPTIDRESQTSRSQVRITGQPSVPAQTASARIDGSKEPAEVGLQEPQQIAAISLQDGAGDEAAQLAGEQPLIFLQPEPTSEPEANSENGPGLVDEDVSEIPFINAASWTVPFPAELSDIGGSVTIIGVKSGSPFWMQPGSVIAAVNDAPVNNLEAWTSHLMPNAITGTAGQIRLKVKVIGSGGDIAEHTFDVPVVRSLTLDDGTIIELRKVRSKWQAVVAATTQSHDGSIRTGDTLLFDFETKTKLNGPRSLENMLKGLEVQAPAQIEFAIVREGSLENATLLLSP